MVGRPTGVWYTVVVCVVVVVCAVVYRGSGVGVVDAVPTFRALHPDFRAAQYVPGPDPEVWRKAELMQQYAQHNNAHNNNNNKSPLYNNLTTPEQIHLSYPGPNAVRIMWVTANEASTFAEMGTESGVYSMGATGSSSYYLAGPWELRFEWVHVVTFDDLKPDTRYYYRVGNSNNMSAEYSVRMLPPVGSTARPLHFSVVGDFGYTNAKSLPGLINDTQSGWMDMLLHVGDMAYNLWDNGGRVGDAYMNQMQPVAANVFYHPAVGNHENDYGDTFHSFKNRFGLPQYEVNDNMYYSVDVGPIHFIGFSTEHYFSLEDPLVELEYNWFVNDLKKASQNRHNVPWIIMYAHRPLYCSNVQLPFYPASPDTFSTEEGPAPTPTPKPDQECTEEAEWLREGMDILGIRMFGIEKLLFDYGVDLYISGHVHSYERTLPVYNNTVMNGTKGAYQDPRATVHIITGSAGCNEGLERFLPHRGLGPWSAFRSTSYGYGHLTVHNATHLHWEQLLDSTGKVLDEMWLVQNNHGPFNAAVDKPHP